MNLYPSECTSKIASVNTRQSNLPSYLNCPFCPAQAYLTRGGQVGKINFRNQGLRQYVCPANHKFLVEETFYELRNDHIVDERSPLRGK